MGRTVMPGICALMGATRPASGIYQQPLFYADRGGDTTAQPLVLPDVAPISACIFAVRFRQLYPKRSL